MSGRPATRSIRAGRKALVGNVRAAGFSRDRLEKIDDVVQCGLVTVVPVGPLGRSEFEMLLVERGMGRFGIEPFANAIATPLEKGNLVLHVCPRRG